MWFWSNPKWLLLFDRNWLTMSFSFFKASRPKTPSELAKTVKDSFNALDSITVAEVKALEKVLFLGPIWFFTSILWFVIFFREPSFLGLFFLPTVFFLFLPDLSYCLGNWFLWVSVSLQFFGKRYKLYWICQEKQTKGYRLDYW